MAIKLERKAAHNFSHGYILLTKANNHCNGFKIVDYF